MFIDFSRQWNLEDVANDVVLSARFFFNLGIVEGVNFLLLDCTNSCQCFGVINTITENLVAVYFAQLNGILEQFQTFLLTISCSLDQQFS